MGEDHYELDPEMDFETVDVDSHAKFGLLSGKAELGKASPRRLLTPWSLHGLLAIANICLCLILLNQTVGRGGYEHLSKSPAKEAIELQYETIETEFAVQSNYTGTPTPELDDAWTALTDNFHLRISLDELKGLNQETVALSDDQGGYLAGLDVLHQLHCLQYIQRMAYKEYYDELPMGITHFEHCVESLRQKLMCLPNDGLVFFDWSPHFSGPMPRFQSQHICMNWERINAWAAARRVSLFDTKAVVHPQYGPSFPDSAEETWEELKHGGGHIAG